MNHTTPAEQRQLKKILKLNTPSKSLHGEYMEEANEFLKELKIYKSLAKSAGTELPVTKAKLLESSIFKRSYLTAWVDDDWFSSFAPSCVAVATPALTILNLYSPPAVVIPASKIKMKGQFFLSVLEHEFVHVNQAIDGNFPEASGFLGDPFENFMEYVTAEFHAYFTQYAHYPESYPDLSKLGFGVTEASILRAYTQTLELTVLDIYKGNLPKKLVEDLLKKLSEELPAAFKKAHLPTMEAIKYSISLPEYLNLAIQNLALNLESPQDLPESFKALRRWIASKTRMNPISN